MISLRENTPPDLTAQNTAAWASPLLKPRDSWKIEVTGSAEYFCTLHVAMKAKLRVINKK